MSTNISKKKRDDLLDKIKQIRAFIAAAPQDENTGNLLSYLSELEKDVNGKKYGLVFEEHREKIDEVLDTHTPVLTEEADLFIDHGGQMNFLLEGDNLAALKLLEKTHRGKIDLIYIDPPYNRGINDFMYDDNFIVKADGYIHSKWLSFIKMRFEIAKKLLSAAGAIFISIDDNEQANLKLLCDSVFGENNFAGMIPWRKRTAKTDVPFGISQDYEWILIYAKSDQFNAFTKRENQRKYFATDDIPGREWRAHDLTTQRTAAERPNSAFTLIDPKSGKEYPVNPNRVWAVTRDTLPQYLRENRIIFPDDYDFLKISKPQMRYYRDEDEAKAMKKTGSTAAYPLFPVGTKGKDVDYDRIVYDTYDFLDKLIGFKLSDLFYAIFHQYYLAYQDNRAERLAKYIKYGTEDSTEIWMLRYGFSFEEIEWLKPCVESIDQTEIRFNGEIESLDDFQRSSVAQYLF